MWIQLAFILQKKIIHDQNYSRDKITQCRWFCFLLLISLSLYLRNLMITCLGFASFLSFLEIMLVVSLLLSFTGHTPVIFFISFEVTVFSLPLSFFIYHKVGNSCNFFLMSFCCKMETIVKIFDSYSIFLFYFQMMELV